MNEPVKILLEEQVGKLLTIKGMQLATAESCTGGLIGHRLTNVAGSSEYYLGGIIAYSNTVKTKLIGVSEDVLKQHGAVSQATVIQMAKGARNLLQSDISVSVSGIAGPGGAMPGKPIGTTWIGLSSIEGEWTRSFIFQGDREENKYSTSDAALLFLIDYLVGNL